jgi:hypothetical protein
MRRGDPIIYQAGRLRDSQKHGEHPFAGADRCGDPPTQSYQRGCSHGHVKSLEDGDDATTTCSIIPAIVPRVATAPSVSTAWRRPKGDGQNCAGDVVRDQL